MNIKDWPSVTDEKLASWSSSTHSVDYRWSPAPPEPVRETEAKPVAFALAMARKPMRRGIAGSLSLFLASLTFAFGATLADKHLPFLVGLGLAATFTGYAWLLVSLMKSNVRVVRTRTTTLLVSVLIVLAVVSVVGGVEFTWWRR